MGTKWRAARFPAAIAAVVLTAGAVLAGSAGAVHLAADSIAEGAVRDLIDAARRPCKLKPPNSVGVSEYEEGFAGESTVNATFVRKGPAGQSDEIVTARWRVTEGKPKPLDPLAGEVNRRCGPDPGKPGSPFEWRSLPYFGGYDQAFLYLITSKRWDNADQVTRHLPTATGSQEWGEVGGYIWRRECDPGKDSVRLKRTIFLPGRPYGRSDIRAGINTLGGVLGPRARPVTEAEVLLNGERILKIKKKGDAFDFDQVPAGAFRHGPNNVVIEAEKRKTGKCNEGKKSTLVGIEFSLYATYASDLEVEVPEHGTGGIGIDLPFTLTAEGPSGIYEAVVDFFWTVHTTGAKSLVRITGAKCDPSEQYITEPPTYGVHFSCRIQNLERGESKQFIVNVILNLPPGGTSASATLSWISRSSGMADPVAGNQNSSRTVNLCQQGSPGCQPAPAGATALRLGL